MYVMALRAATLFINFWGELQLISIVGLLILVKYFVMFDIGREPKLSNRILIFYIGLY